MTQNFPSTMEQDRAASLTPMLEQDKAVPARCAKLAEMPFAELLYTMLVTEQKTTA